MTNRWDRAYAAVWTPTCISGHALHDIRPICYRRRALKSSPKRVDVRNRCTRPVRVHCCSPPIPIRSRYERYDENPRAHAETNAFEIMHHRREEGGSASPLLSSPFLSRWGNRYRFSSAITTGEPWRAIVTRQHYSRVVVLFITSLTYAEFDEYTTRKFKLVTRVEGAKIGEPVSRFEKTNILSKGISSRETRDTFVSANCIIFNLYPVHAILDTVATPAQLVTPSSS